MAEGEQSKLNAEEEIRQLERQLEQRKRELAQTSPEVPPEKEVFREVLKEHIEMLRPAAPTPATPVLPAPTIPVQKTDEEQKQDTLRKEADQIKLQTLIDFALSGTIEEAVKKAENDAYLLDELHDRLVDHYYDKLVQLRKITQL